MRKHQEESYPKWSKSSRSFFERLAAELEEYSKSEGQLTVGDQDVQYYLELQKNRLEKKDWHCIMIFNREDILRNVEVW